MTDTMMRPRNALNKNALYARALRDRNETLLDAVISAAALVALADGHVVPSERRSVLDFLNREGLLALFTRDEILDELDARIAEFAKAPVSDDLQRDVAAVAGTSVARLVLGVSTHVAQADDDVTDAEDAAIARIAATLGRLPPTRRSSVDAA